MSFTVIPLKELRQGVRLPIAIFDGQNTSLMLLNKGIELSPDNLDALRRRGISHVAVDSRFVREVWVSPQAGRSGLQMQKHFLAEQRKKTEQRNQPLTSRITKPAKPQYDRELVNHFTQKNETHVRDLQEFMNSMQNQKLIRSDVVKNMTTESIEDLLQDVDLFVKLVIEESQDSENHQHCLRVAKLSMSIATLMEFREDDVRQLGIGCLLSRVGLTAEIQNLMESSRVLSPIELLELRKHPGNTWAILEKISDLPVGARQVAWQINERWNGTGYPRGRSQKQIHPLARVAAVADVYIALTTPRPYRAAYSSYDAIRILLKDTQNGLFDPEALRGLLKTICLYPLGSCVELSDQTLCLTVRNNPEFYDRPTVQLICDLHGNPLPEQFIDLAIQRDLQVLKCHPRSHLQELLERSLNEPVGLMSQEDLPIAAMAMDDW